MLSPAAGSLQLHWFSRTLKTSVTLNLKLNSMEGTTPMHSHYTCTRYLSYLPRYDVNLAYFNFYVW